MIRIIRLLLLLVIFVNLFVFSVVSFAETKTFIKDYTYMASDIDSKVSCRAIALEQVKRALLEQLGTFLISETEVRNYQMTKDQITTLTAGVVSAEVIDEKWDGRTYFLKARISADPKAIAKSLDALRQDKEKSKELEETKQIAEEAMKEVERLKKDLESVKANNVQQRDYNSAINVLSASDWLYSGIVYGVLGNMQQAINDLNKAIELNPQFAEAYYNRGIAYGNLGNNRKAIKDFDKAIEMKSQYARAYFYRGIAYLVLENSKEALSNFSTVIQLNPQNAEAYFNRGFCWLALKNTPAAIKDFDKAIELNPQFAAAYDARSKVYDKLGNTQQAVKDHNKAIELKSELINGGQ